MKKKTMILCVMILVLALVFVTGATYLYQKSKQLPQEETIELAQIQHFLSVTDESVREEFIQKCQVTLDEKGYLPKDATMQEMISFVNEKQPELCFGYKSLSVAVRDGQQVLALRQLAEGNETEEAFVQYTMNCPQIPQVIHSGTKLDVLATDNTILLISNAEETALHVEAAWIKANNEKGLSVKYGDTEFMIANHDDSYVGYEDIADIEIADGGVKTVKVYTDKINDRLISIKEHEIELETAGTYTYTDNIQVYKLFGEYEPYTLSNLKIGYDFTDFVLNDKGEIVAALVTREGVLDKIRVVVKTTGFESAYHENVTLSCDTDMIWKSGDKSGEVKAGEEISLSQQSDMFDGNRVIFVPAALSSKIKIFSIERNQGTPAYRGILEVEKTPEGLLVINELPLDEYLYSVVPSEMPASYPLEALKAQAVSARTYAYAHMDSSRLQSYGAHVDDSAAFQVYNNIMEHDMTTQAVRETEGVIVCKNGKPVTTYFYSTSCGYGTDLGAWVTSEEDYLQARRIADEIQPVENTEVETETSKNYAAPGKMTDNEVFADYIKSADENGYEMAETFYRWKYETQVDESLLLENLQKRYEANPHQILTKTADGFVQKEIDNFGSLMDIQIVKRAQGGAVMEMDLVGSEATVKILSEKNVRYILANVGTTLWRGADYSNEGSVNGMIPSAFIALDLMRGTECKEEDTIETEPTETEQAESKISAYTVWGGGFGHGIGMSQNGARQMAKRGMGYKDILSFFYVDTELKTMKKDEVE